MLKNCSTDYSKMHQLVAWLVVFSVMSMANGKTEEEWTAAIDQLMYEFRTAYNVHNQTALKEIMTADVHFFPPGHPEVLGLTGNTFPTSGQLGDIEEELRAFCGTGAVYEVKFVSSVLDESSDITTTRNGKGMALVQEEGDTVKLRSMIWNFDD